MEPVNHPEGPSREQRQRRGEPVPYESEIFRVMESQFREPRYPLDLTPNEVTMRDSINEHAEETGKPRCTCGDGYNGVVARSPLCYWHGGKYFPCGTCGEWHTGRMCRRSS